MSDNKLVKRYICDLVIAVCAVIGGLAQLRHVILNWQVGTEESEDKDE